MKCENILQAIVHHAKTQPNKIAFSYVEGRSIESLSKSELTYRELFLKAYSLSIKIQKITKPGDRVLLCYPSGLDFIVAFYACLLAQVIAVPVVVPSNVGLAKKFFAIFDNANPALLLTDTIINQHWLQNETFKKFDIQIGQCDALSKIPCLSTDEFDLVDAFDVNQYQLPLPDEDDIAFLQYTSGSTAQPKGVMVTHANLADNIALMAKAYQLMPTDSVITWLPHTHDMGLVGCLLMASNVGGACFIVSQSSYIRSPIFWFELVSYFQVTISVSPNFALDLCVKKMKSYQQCLDLRCLKCFIIGSEPIAVQNLNKFAAAFAPYGFNSAVFAPSYGLAECTLMVSSRFDLKTLSLQSAALRVNQVKIDPDGQHQIVSCGNPYQSVKIVKPDTLEVVGNDEVGEILISGESVTKGYWQAERHTKAVYDVQLPDDNNLYFKTGDLGFMHEGELYITGRIKEVIIVNGLNYYPEDVENCVSQCDARFYEAPVVAFAYRAEMETDTDSFVVLIKRQREVNVDEENALIVKARMAILKTFQLVPFDIQFVNKSFPKTTSGKIQRNSCAQLYNDLRERSCCETVQ